MYVSRTYQYMFGHRRRRSLATENLLYMLYIIYILCNFLSIEILQSLLYLKWAMRRQNVWKVLSIVVMQRMCMRALRNENVCQGVLEFSNDLVIDVAEALFVVVQRFSVHSIEGIRARRYCIHMQQQYVLQSLCVLICVFDFIVWIIVKLNSCDIAFKCISSMCCRAYVCLSVCSILSCGLL